MSAITKQLEFDHHFNERVDLESYINSFLKTNRKSYYFVICSCNGDGTGFDQRPFHKTEQAKAMKYIKRNLHRRIFLSTSLFGNRSKMEERIVQIKKIILDLDTYKSKFKGVPIEQILKDIQEKFFATGKIPTANAITYSGGGLYLEFNLQYTPGGKVLQKRRVVAKILYEMLKDYGADAKTLDASHVFSLADTTNWKYGEGAVVKTYKNDVPDYSLAELARSLPNLWDVWKVSRKIQIEKDPKRTGKSKATVAPIHKERTLSYSQIQSIKKLIEIRGGYMEGYREMALFFIRNAYHKMHTKRFNDKDKTLYAESLELAHEVNQTFTKPLKAREVEKGTLNTKKLYRFRTETINDWFDISMDEQIQLKLKTKEAKNEKSRRQMEELRRGQGVMAREEYELERTEGKEHLLNLLRRHLERNPKAKRKELAELLGVTAPRITQLKKEL
ncbi:replication protein [Rossellomorea marisflavi]|uniref:replication protein n=1 Tax=Rossellomorea marisflavi TaxID=189381 RepID=UPI001EE23EFE|nr:replication protein [Rossellomorea marisflavi]UKS67698.1 replication protein [Rossellomorea marisflavi]